MTKDEEIIKLFYEEHKRPVDIAEQLKVSKSAITKAIQKDERYAEEKEKRMQLSKEKHKESKKKYIRKKRQEEKSQYQALMFQINKDNAYLSNRKQISDLAFSKWNRSIYEYDKKSSDLVLKQGINTGADIPKRVRNVYNPNFIKQAV